MTPDILPWVWLAEALLAFLYCWLRSPRGQKPYAFLLRTFLLIRRPFEWLSDRHGKVP